jgi:hypothetical protein
MAQESIIKDLNLSHEDVLKIVLEWYTKGMYADILQDEDGLDLEEILENMLYCTDPS